MFKPKKQLHAKFFKPKKNLGQNFLKNEKIAADIAKAADLSQKDTVIEIGPGTGILTDELIKSDAQIFAIEKDFDLLSKLQKRYHNVKNLKLVHQDALWFSLDNLKSYKVVANIPYNITSPIIRKFLGDEKKPEIMVLMVQKEVAERICAKAGSSERGLLTIIVEFFADTEILFEVSKKEFYPMPKVDSAVIKITTNIKNKDIDTEKFFKIVKAGFSLKRRQLHNSLAATFHWDRQQTIDVLSKADIEPTLRAEDLTLEQWFRLYAVFSE